MKSFKSKKLILLVIVCLTAFNLHAAKSDWSFKVISPENLYAEPFADPYNFKSTVNVVFFTNKLQNKMELSTLLENKSTKEFCYKYLSSDDSEYCNDKYIYMKLAENIGLFRTRYNGNGKVPSFDFELNVAGSLDTMFSISGGSCALAYDGAFMVAGSLRIADSLTIRTGLHHTSGHWGDEFLDGVLKYNGVSYQKYNPNNPYSNYATLSLENQDYYLIKTNEYTRDNSWLFALSGSPLKGLRIYGEAELPLKKAWIRPFTHARADVSPVGDDFLRLGASSSLNETEEGRALLAAERDQKSSSYKGWRIHGGAEYSFPTKIGDAVVGFDIQAHQDGQNKNQDILSYSSSNPWDFEYTFGAGFLFKDAALGNRHLGVQAMYHIGRMPVAQMYYKKASLLYIGICIK